MSEGIVLALLTFVVSLLYSSVGHGGASGYLALLSFFTFSHEQMATSALSLNLLIAGMAFWSFLKADHFSWRLIWPFTVASIPFAFIGGWLKVPSMVYSFLLAGVLIFAAWRLLFEWNPGKKAIKHRPPLAVCFSIGGSVGVLSGLVGVGGGIFLSPLFLLFRWADPKKTAATSAFFILANSSAGLLGRFASDQLQWGPVPLYMVLTALVGGMVGSRLGAHHFSANWLRRILAAVLLIAALKLLRALSL